MYPKSNHQVNDTNGEKQFAMMKAGLCFHQIVGYGKKQVADENMLARITKLEKDLEQLRDELQMPLSKISAKEQQLSALLLCLRFDLRKKSLLFLVHQLFFLQLGCSQDYTMKKFL